MGFDTGMANAFQGIIRPDWFDKVFQRCIKNTLEDELADIAIRLFDLAGALGIDFDKMNPCRYYRAFDKFSFTENAFALCKGLSLDVDLAWHIEQKMKDNENRSFMHNKKY